MTCVYCTGRVSKRADDFDEMLTSADESELDPLQWKDSKDMDKDAMSNSNALEFDDDGVEWSKDFDRDSQSPTSRKRPSYMRCVVVALLVLLVVAGVCVAVLLLRQRMQGALMVLTISNSISTAQSQRQYGIRYRYCTELLHVLLFGYQANGLQIGLCLPSFVQCTVKRQTFCQLPIAK